MSKCCGRGVPYPVLAAAACAGILAGCGNTDHVIWDSANAAHFTGSNPTGSNPKIPLVSQPLLAPQPQPDCEYRTSADDGTGEGKKSRSDVDADQAYRVKLEHERECYREAEIRARERLHQLQTSISKSISAIQPQGTRRPIARPGSWERLRTADPGP